MDLIYALPLVVLLFAPGFAKKLEEKFSWKSIDYIFNSTDTRQEAIATFEYVPLLNIPHGLEVWEDKLFISVHRFLHARGIPSSLNYVNISSVQKSPLFTPYPNWALNEIGTGNIDSALHMHIDVCGRLWVSDYTLTTSRSQLLIFDLKTDTLIKKFNLTSYTKAALMTGNIVVDVEETNCAKAFAYITLEAYSLFLYQFNILVLDLENEKTWEVSRFLETEINTSANYKEEIKEKLGLMTELTGIALSNQNPDGYRTLYVQPLNTSYIFNISTENLRNSSVSEASSPYKFAPLGFKGPHTESSFLYFDEKTGILFYDLVAQNSIGCWNSKKYPNQFSANTTAIIKCDKQLRYVFNLKGDESSHLWIASKKERVDQPPYDFSLFYVNMKEFIAGTICE